MRKAGTRLRVGIAAVTAAGTLAVCTGPAAAAVTIGQVGPPDPAGCTPGFDWVQPTVTSGNSYVVPSIAGITSLTVTSWSTHGGPSESPLTMKIYRKVADPDTYRVVGHAGPHTVAPGGTAGNTFPANIPTQPGDVLGLHAPANDYCVLAEIPGEQAFFHEGDLADGASAQFFFNGGSRLNISAVVSPTNTFSLARTQRNKKKGTAILTFNLLNPGDLSASGNGAKVAGGAVASKVVPAGPATLRVKARGMKKRKLNEKGKVKLPLTVTYTPTGGEPRTQPLKVKLRKKLKR